MATKSLEFYEVLDNLMCVCLIYGTTLAIAVIAMTFGMKPCDLISDKSSCHNARKVSNPRDLYSKWYDHSET